MAVALDSDVVVGFLDLDDVLHGAADSAIRELIGEQQLVVSAITYAEVLTGAHLGHHEVDAVAGFFVDLITEVIPAEALIAETAARLRGAQSSLRMPDALILATAEVSPDVNLLVSGDAAISRVADVECAVRLLR